MTEESDRITKVVTYDSTLRDGEQGEGVSLSLEDKLRIVEVLDEFGIDIIEGGFPASNPKDIAFFERVRELPLSHARIAAFGSTCKKDCAAAEDEGLQNLIGAGTSIVTIVGKAWDQQVEHVLQTTLDENLRMIRDSDAGKGLMHESYDKDDPSQFSRAWFAWANTLFGELVLSLLDEGKSNLLSF